MRGRPSGTAIGATKRKIPPYGGVLRRFATSTPSGNGITLSAIHPAYRHGRTLFPSRVFDPDEMPRVLKSGLHSRKIGKTVMKGRLKGAPIFTLTLEERATCPRSCEAWAICYGNNMQAAERITPGPALEQSLWGELENMQEDYPGGFLVRLHVLGDFYSVDYVEMWGRALAAFPALHIFGYTARLPGTPIGDAIERLAEGDWGRFAIRFSGRDAPLKSAVLGDHRADSHPAGGAIICPAQTEKTDCCATCALCWQSDRSIMFLRH